MDFAQKPKDFGKVMEQSVSSVVFNTPGVESPTLTHHVCKLFPEKNCVLYFGEDCLYIYCFVKIQVSNCGFSVKKFFQAKKQTNNQPDTEAQTQTISVDTQKQATCSQLIEFVDYHPVYEEKEPKGVIKSPKWIEVFDQKGFFPALYR